MTGDRAEEAAWRFALAVYAEPGVADACLTLQDRAGVDVVLLLVAGLQARRGQILDQAAIARLALVVVEWRTDVVTPLRAVRRRLKQTHLSVSPDAIPALRDHVKEAELAAERLELAALMRALDLAEGATPLPPLEQLRRVVQQAGKSAEPGLEGHLDVIAAAMARVTIG